MQHVARRLAVAAVVLLATACTPTPGEEQPTLVLGDDCGEGCPGGLECQFGRCGVASGPPLRIDLEFVPPQEQTTLQPQVVQNLGASPGAQLPTLRLSRAVETAASVRFVPDELGGSRSAAAVLAFRPRITAGATPRVFYARARDGGEVVPEGIGPLDDAPPLYLPPGVYDVSVTPLESDVPPAMFEAVTIDVASPSPEFALTIPDAAAARVDGRLLVVREDGVVGLAGARITATDAEGEQVSTTGETDEDGAFFVILPGVSRSWRFEVTPGDGGDPQPYVRFAPFDLRTLSDDLELLVSGWADPIEVTIDARGGDGDPLDAVGSLAATALPSTAGSPLGPAVESGVALVSTTALRDEEGALRIELQPGAVEVTLGALDGENGLRTFPARTVPAATTGLGSFTLPSRRRVVIDVRDPLGTPVRSARIDLEPRSIAATSGATLPLSLFGASTATDAAGRGEVRVQPGQYDVEISGGRGAVAVAGVTFEQPVSTGTDASTEVVLDFAGVVGGRLLDPDGVPLAGVTVRAWRPDGAGARPLATGVTDHNGRYRLSLPFDSDGL